MRNFCILLWMSLSLPAKAQQTTADRQDIPCISPLQGQERPYITSSFGIRFHPLDKEYRQHTGIDMACPRGFQLVYATAHGRVSFAGTKPGLGVTVILDHASGYRSLYGHLSEGYVRVGDTIRMGDIIGLMGRTGRVTGTHLHYSIWWNGKWVDPLPYLSLYEQLETKKDARRTSEKE